MWQEYAKQGRWMENVVCKRPKWLILLGLQSVGGILLSVDHKEAT